MCNKLNKECYNITVHHSNRCENRIIYLLDYEGNDMQTKEKDCDRRIDQRSEHPLKISLYDQSGKAINISATGVYFEVITEDVDAFSPGATIPIHITADTSAHGTGERKIKLNGNGTVIINKIKKVTSHGSELGVAVQFNEHLNITDYSVS